MKVIRTISEFRTQRKSFSCVGLVPTMGAFHEGHLSLMRTAKIECGSSAVSLFVNPTQFGPHEDFARYPRNEDRDFGLAANAGVDLMFAPPVDEIYPRHTTVVHVSEVAESFEGSVRSQHFDGVATIVSKLFHIIEPTVSYFGLKDLQQCAVVQRMVEDLDFPTKLRFIEVVREHDGLAMSSRNVYLTSSERAVAPKLYQQLTLCAEQVSTGACGVAEAISSSLEYLNSNGFSIDYFALVNPTTMIPSESPQSTDRLVVAARLGHIRLLDNVPLIPAI